MRKGVWYRIGKLDLGKTQGGGVGKIDENIGEIQDSLWGCDVEKIEGGM